MKIALYSGTISDHLTQKVLTTLRKHAPQHHYFRCDEDESKPEVWYCLTPHHSAMFMLNAHRSVVSVANTNFINYPHLYSFRERLFLLPVLREHCRRAARLITYNNHTKQVLVESLGIDAERIEVCMPLMTSLWMEERYDPTPDEMLSVRSKYQLPASYILTVGSIDSTHHLQTLLFAIVDMKIPLDLVVCGRRTVYVDVLRELAREYGVSSQLHFIYEFDAEDLASIYNMALVLTYLPSMDNSVLPIIEGVRLSVPMILSDTALNREAAGDAALYVDPKSEDEIASALRTVIYDESYRGQLIAQCQVEKCRYSEEEIATRMSKIYESV